jgi:hypothetical protein
MTCASASSFQLCPTTAPQLVQNTVSAVMDGGQPSTPMAGSVRVRQSGGVNHFRSADPRPRHLHPRAADVRGVVGHHCVGSPETRLEEFFRRAAEGGEAGG